MVTLGAVGPAGPAGPAGPLPSPYSVDSGFFLVDEAVQQAAVSISCHPEDIAVGGMWFAYPTETTFFSGGGSSWNGYHATLNNSESEFSVRVIVSCLDFSEPLHSGSRDSAICDYDASDPGDYRCSPADH